MAGTIVMASARSGGNPNEIDMVEFLATADSSAATFPTIDLASFGVWGTLLVLQTKPGSTAPTDNYDITLIDADGADRLDSVGLNRDTSTTERVTITGAPWVAKGESLTLTIANNAVNSATIGIKIWFTRSANTAPGFAQALSSAVDSIAIGAAASGGATPWRSLDLDETEEEVKATAGTLYWLNWTNRTASVRYLKVYDNTAAGTTVGTTVPVLTIEMPANASDHVAAVAAFGSVGMAFSTGLCLAATTGFADNDTGAPGANDIIVNALYK